MADAADATQAAPAATVAKAPATVALPLRWVTLGAAALAALAAAAAVLAWSAQQRVRHLEAELVRRQHDSAAVATEARTLARQAEVNARDAVAKMALLEARVAETAMQRTQFEDLIQSLARSRDENVLADVEAALRVALQQSAITGSAEPLLQALRQSDERLARHAQPQLQRVRRAIAQDLERTRAAATADVLMLSNRLDDVIRQIDDLPLLASPTRSMARAAPRGSAGPAAASTAASAALPAASGAAGGALAPLASWRSWWQGRWDHVLSEVRALVRVTPIEHPEAMLIAPDQAFFLRENLKLRLLNARLALLSRQFDTAQSDLREAIAVLERYFERGGRRTVAALDALRQVQAQARTVFVPRPDAALAAIAAAAAGR